VILTIFLVIVGLAIALLSTGFMLEDTALQLVGFSFLFIAGSILLSGVVEYKIGENNYKTYAYGDNYTSEHWSYDTPKPNCNSSDPLECVVLFHINESITYKYITFNDSTSHWIGIYLMIVSVIGSAVIFTRLKQENE